MKSVNTNLFDFAFEHKRSKETKEKVDEER